MKVFYSLSLLFLLQNPACFLVTCAPVSIEHHELPATSTAKAHAIFTYLSRYDLCWRGKTSSTQEPFYSRVTLDRAMAAQMSQEQAIESLLNAAPRSATVLSALSVQQEDKGPAMTTKPSLHSRTLLVCVYRTLKVVMTSLRCRVGSVMVMFGWIGSSDDGLIVTGLILSMMMQIMLVYWIWMDARAVCIRKPTDRIQACTLTHSFFASWSTRKWIAFNNRQTLGSRRSLQRKEIG